MSSSVMRRLFQMRRLSVVCVAAAVGLTGCGDSDAPPSGQAGGANASQPAGSASPDAARMVEEAVALIRERQFGKAVEKLNQALQADRTCADAWFQRAGILADAGQDQLALNDYSKAVELAPTEVRFRNMRGLFLLTRQKHDDALADFTKVIELDPKFVQAWNNRGLVKLSMQNPQGAVDDFSKSVEIDPNYADGFNNRGFACFQAELNDQALKDFNQTLKLKPDYVNAYNNRGMLFMRLKKFRDAVEDFSQAIRLEDANPKHYQNRRVALLELGETGQAQADGRKVAWLSKLTELNAVVARNPDKADNYIQRASHLADAGQHEIAQANFEQAIKVAPKDSTPWTSRAQYWFDQGQFEKTISDATEAIHREFSHQALSIRGDAFLKLGQLDQAIADFESAKRLDRSVAEAYFKRAQLRQRTGDSEGAQDDVEHARQLDSTIGK